jgi:ribonuclease HI
LLFTDSIGRTCSVREWRFVLQPTDGGEHIAASDSELEADGMRLDLLAVVRGLEALDTPSRVTLLVANRFVRRGIRRDMAQWRAKGWRWERFGTLAPIRDLDLWKRIDRALSIHQVQCFAWNADEAEFTAAANGENAPAACAEPETLCEEPNIVIVPRRGSLRPYPQRRQAVPTAQQPTLWGQDVPETLTRRAPAALSRTA